MRHRIARLIEASAVLVILLAAYFVAALFLGPWRHLPLGSTELTTKDLSMETETPHGLPSYVSSLLRTVLGLAGGYLIGKGYFTAEQMPQVIGGVIAIVTAGWGLWQKINAHKALKAAIAAPAGAAK